MGIALWRLLPTSIAGEMICEIPIFYESFELIDTLYDFISFGREFHIFAPKKRSYFIVVVFTFMTQMNIISFIIKKALIFCGKTERTFS